MTNTEYLQQEAALEADSEAILRDHIDSYMERFEAGKLDHFSAGEKMAYNAWYTARHRGSPMVEMYRAMIDSEIVDFVRTLREAGYTEMLYTARDRDWLFTLGVLDSLNCEIGTYETIEYPDPYVEDAYNVTHGIVVTL